MRFASALGATVLSAAVHGLAFPPLRLRPLAWICLVPFLLALRRTRLPVALLLAFLWAELASYFVGEALPVSISTYFDRSRLFGWAMALGVWGFTGSLYYMVFALAYRGVARRAPLVVLPLLAAAAWAAAELLRGRLLTGSEFFVGNPWALFAYSQAGFDAFLQVAALTGPYGISFALVAVNAALAEVWIAWRAQGGTPALTPSERRPPLRTALRGLALACLPALAALAYGVATLRGSEARAGSASVPVAVVQGNLDLGHVWRSDFYGRNLAVYLDLTREAFARGESRIVFWPEAALTFFLEEEPDYARAIAHVLAEGGAELVTGGPSQVLETGSPAPRYRNSVFLLSPSGQILGRYDKQHLVPFAESFPLRRFDFLRRRFERVRVFTPGEPTPPLPTRAGAAGILTCNEAMLPELAAARAREGAEYLVNPSNDTWLADHDWAAHMFDLVSLRAVEQRRWLVRASTSGPSAIVDPWGRVVASAEVSARVALLGAIEPRRELSPYARAGDLFAGLCAAAVVAALAFGSRRSQTRPSQASARSAA